MSPRTKKTIGLALMIVPIMSLLGYAFVDQMIEDIGVKQSIFVILGDGMIFLLFAAGFWLLMKGDPES